jgi:dihydrofolate reductase
MNKNLTPSNSPLSGGEQTGSLPDKGGVGRVAFHLSIIVAMARNRTIGINNTLPWRCPEDLKHFKALTMGHHMIMGRKTFDSIGKPLPGRTTVVVTRNSDLSIEGCLVAHSLQEAIELCAGDAEVFIVGGAELYGQALNIADTLYITEIQQEVEGDAFFPEFDALDWQEAAREVRSQETPQPLVYHFVTYRKK